MKLYIVLESFLKSCKISLFLTKTIVKQIDDLTLI